MAEPKLRNPALHSGIALASGHDAGLYADVFRRHGRIHIPAFLHDGGARAVHEALAMRTP